jgi:hypothetical protein
MKNLQILTTDFTEYQLTNYNTSILEAAKKRCSSKITFHQSEINLGYTSTPYHFEQLEKYMSEFRKWVPIVNAAKARDKKADE